MQHHRFTNDAVRDPDHFGHKLDWLSLLRWTNFDYFYTRFFLEQAGPMRAKFIMRVIGQIALVIAIVTVSFSLGFGKEVVMLWLLPTRISSALFVTMFVYLPHAPFFATAKENEYRASNIRAGVEWLLTPLMAYQNYHLVHHLYPTAPFYRMRVLWRAKLREHLAHDPFFVATFGVGREAPVPATMLKEANRS
jgi:fatty acid desaturase